MTRRPIPCHEIVPDFRSRPWNSCMYMTYPISWAKHLVTTWHVYIWRLLHSSGFFSPPAFWREPPPSMPMIQLRPGICIGAAGGYSLPPIFVFGVHVHHSDCGTPSKTCWTWLPHPRHDFFAVLLSIYQYLKVQLDHVMIETHRKLSRLRQSTWCSIGKVRDCGYDQLRCDFECPTQVSTTGDYALYWDLLLNVNIFTRVLYVVLETGESHGRWIN